MINIEKRPVEDAVADGLLFVEEIDGKRPQIIQSPKVNGEEWDPATSEYPSGSDLQQVWYPIYDPESKTLTIEKGDYSIDEQGNHRFKHGLRVNWLP